MFDVTDLVFSRCVMGALRTPWRQLLGFVL
jgi:hypothetical protein